MNFIFEYALFFAKSITIVAVIIILLVFILSQRKKSPSGSLEIKDLSENYEQMQETMSAFGMSDEEAKQWQKAERKQKKLASKQRKKKAKQDKKIKSAADEQQAAVQTEELFQQSRAKLYVLSFNGSVDAHEVEDLRQEVTAILSVIKPQDKVVIKLESPGGVVHGYGLAASQLMRFRKRDIPFTAVVDKVAASGGYMMACTANKIIAAPFAIIGSIGVVAQIPNFHRLLKKNDIDVELQTAGEYKRTLTMFGENTPEGREKFKQELEEVHHLFKDFVQENRPNLAIDEVATGEHWFATQAKEKGLVDEIGTSDDFILEHLDAYKILSVKYRRHTNLTDKVTKRFVQGVERLFFRRQMLK
ncbi:protease SohB [Utexia brackfieldae]|uniref:protease SohB n=1 Tax=Utexia brackfieldae TaxID=3074108 RepID=UPI00370DD07F